MNRKIHALPVTEGDHMKSRRSFLTSLYLGITALLTAILASACGAKPDAETEPSPEWPPKDE